MRGRRSGKGRGREREREARRGRENDRHGSSIADRNVLLLTRRGYIGPAIRRRLRPIKLSRARARAIEDPKRSSFCSREKLKPRKKKKRRGEDLAKDATRQLDEGEESKGKGAFEDSSSERATSLAASIVHSDRQRKKPGGQMRETTP